MTQVEGDSAKPADDQSKQPKRDRTHWLYILVIVGVVAGVVVGLVAPDTG
jgi:aerobic C4-dicarboxylate transport protein